MTATVLDPQRRGDPFEYSATLQGDWVESMFAGGFKFTLRTKIPESTVTDDADAAVVDQATSADSDIVFSDDTSFTVFLPSTRTTSWPRGTLYWDLAGQVDADHGYTIDSGTIMILGDITRSQ